MLFVRDANIKLSQNGTSSNDSNLGFVPLLTLKTTYKVNADWRLVLDTDLAVAHQGRAIDMALSLRRQFNNGWDIGAGYRTIEGGDPEYQADIERTSLLVPLTPKG